MIKRLLMLFAFLGLLFNGLIATTTPATADTTVKNSDGLCLVTPEEIVLIEHEAEYVDEARWKRDIPAIEEESHVENRFFRDIPDVAAEYKKLYTFFRDIPAVEETFDTWYRWKLVEETTVNEYRYKKIVPSVDGVQECQYKKWVKDYTTEYKYAKHVRTKTRTSEVWANFSPKNKREPYVGPPSWPTDPDGKWEVHKDIPPGHSGDNGVYQKGGGNSSWFYRHNAGDWSGFGPWTLWSPLSHVSWETFDQPSIGEPAFHADGSNDGTDWYRQWQVRNTGDTRQVENGGHWEYQWFTEDPGEGWTKTDECRWKVEPVAEQTVWFPSEDGWTQDSKDAPWVLDASRTVAGPDDISWFPSEDGWTKELKTEPWIKVAEESRGNGDAVEGYREFKTVDGTTLVESEASEFEISEFPGWEVLAERSEETSPAVEGWREYLTEDGTPSKDILDAVWFAKESVEGWKLLDSKTVITTEAAEGYTEYYVAGGEPTRELGESNWTTNVPEGWTFVDSRERETKAAWTEEEIIPAEWDECDEDPKDEPEELAYTGANDATGIYLGISALLILLGSLFAWLRFRKQ